MLFRSGVYIPKKNEKLARQLAEKDHFIKLLKEAKKELHLIDNMLKSFSVTGLTDVYTDLNKYRKALIKPLVETDEMYAKRWEQEAYVGKGFTEKDPEYYTRRGERVRSKSEIIIANTLQENGIPYKYECPIYIEGVGNLYPDFTILKIKTRQVCYLEHYGMLSDENYLNNFFRKQSNYTRNGIILGKNLYMTFESKNNHINTKDLEIMIKEVMDV